MTEQDRVAQIADYTVTEHATRTKGGTMHVRYTSPRIEEVYPLATWIEHNTSGGGKVYRRTIIVVSDWEEVK